MIECAAAVLIVLFISLLVAVLWAKWYLARAPRTYIRGHLAYWINEKNGWCYADNGKRINDYRSCAQCGEPPTIEGYDACLGFIDGVEHACCGHGVEDGYIIWMEQSDD